MNEYDLIYTISENPDDTVKYVTEVLNSGYMNKILIFTNDSKGLESLYGTKNLQIVIPIIDKSIPKSQWSDHIQCYVKSYKNSYYYNQNVEIKLYNQKIKSYINGRQCKIVCDGENTTNGFFWLLNGYLKAISDMIKNNISIENINYKNCWNLYSDNGENLYNLLFDNKTSNKINLYEKYNEKDPIPYKNCHVRYTNLSFSKDIIDTYFQDSDVVKNKIKNFIETNEIDFENTIAVYYRSSDKITEVPIPKIEEFIHLVKIILKRNNNLKILFQSDSLEATEIFKKQFVNNCIINKFLERTNEKKGIHFLLKGEKLISDIVEFYSMISLMSKCKYLICSWSNASYYAIMKRGNTTGVLEYEQNATLSKTDTKYFFNNIPFPTEKQNIFIGVDFHNLGDILIQTPALLLLSKYYNIYFKTHQKYIDILNLCRPNLNIQKCSDEMPIDIKIYHNHGSHAITHVLDQFKNSHLIPEKEIIDVTPALPLLIPESKTLKYDIAINKRTASVDKNYNDIEWNRLEKAFDKIGITYIWCDDPKYSLMEVCENISNSKIYIGLDTGTTHLAACMRKPTIVLWANCWSYDEFGYPELQIKFDFEKYSKKLANEKTLYDIYIETLKLLNKEQIGGEELKLAYKPYIKDTTLICIDCVNIDRAITAIEKSLTHIKIDKVKLLTSLPTTYSNTVKIDPITSIEEFSKFCIKKLVNYIDTKYVLLIQHDGWVLNGLNWSDEFYNYDYIGGISWWTESGDTGKGGNGGFSFRSKKLLQFAKNNIDENKCHPEDNCISKMPNRKIFEDAGFNFATRKIQNQFSVEDIEWKGSFGHHKSNLINYLDTIFIDSDYFISAYYGTEKIQKNVIDIIITEINKTGYVNITNTILKCDPVPFVKKQLFLKYFKNNEIQEIKINENSKLQNKNTNKIKLNTECFLNKYFRFGRIYNDTFDNSVNIIKFLENGKVYGYSHFNETYWEVQNGCMCLLDGNRKITTIFDHKKVDCIIGNFLGGQPVTHYLKEMPETDIKNWNGKKINLKDTTLICIDCLNINQAIYSIEVCKHYASFSDIKFLTSADITYNHIIKIPKINNIEEYSKFCLKELYKYVDTKYMLIIQHDGYILNPDMWNDDWYNFDYIGVVHTFKYGGCGGFSFRTKKLMEFVANNIPKNLETKQEDGVICNDMYDILNKNNFKFKKDENFGYNDQMYVNNFGHHRGRNIFWNNPIKDINFHCHLNKYEENINLYIDEFPRWHEYFKNIVVISKYDINSEELRNIKLIKEHKNITIQKFDAIYPKESHPAFENNGFYGCALSHYNVIKLAKQNNWNNVMILEDDVVLHKQFNHYMNEIIDELKTIEWDIFYGYKNNPFPNMQTKTILEYKTINQIDGILSSHCYCINKKCYEYLINIYENIFKKTSISQENTLDRFMKKDTFIKKYTPKINLSTPILRSKNMSNIQVPYMNEIINKDYKLFIEQIESPIINTCNLSCENCSALSPYHKNNYYTITQFENDIKQLSKYVNCDTFHLLGGEPLLLPNLEDYIDILIKYKISKNITIITNGLLLPNYKNKNIFNKITTLIISYYPDVKTHIIVDKWLSENRLNCKIDKRQIKEFKEQISFIKLNYDSYSKCEYKKCNELYNGNFYLCPESNFNQKLLKMNKITDDLNDGIDIYNCDDITNFIVKYETLKSKPLKNCSYCHGSCGKLLSHKQIKVDKVF